MPIHERDHDFNGVDHLPGTTPAAGEVNLVGTGDAGALVEITLEPAGEASTSDRIVRRAGDGHIAVPEGGQDDDEVLAKSQVVALIDEGVWKAPAHSFVADHTSAAVGDGGSGGPALSTGDIVVNTTDEKVYVVTSGSGTGAAVTWDSGYLPVTQEVRYDKLTDHDWYFETDGGAWIDRGSTDHSRQHAMTSTSDHTAGNYKLFYSDGAGEVQELTLASGNKPLVGKGNAAPSFGGFGFAGIVTCAGDAPAASDVSAWDNDSLGIGIGASGDRYLIWKDSSGTYATEFGAV